MDISTTSGLTDRLLEQRIILVGEEITDDLANRVVSQLLVLSNDDPTSDISLYINSPGGSVLAGLAIYDVMQLVPNDVATLAVGMAASMGQILLCGGAPGKRCALANAQVLMHEGSAGLGGSAADVEIQAAHLESTLRRLRSIIAHHTGASPEQITRDVGRDRWFDAAAAREYGFVDHVVNTLADIRPHRQPRTIGVAAAVSA
ncbi:MAG: ATP-dependent Clp protease proteolytic subunit [Actinomycetota bacterium]